MALTLALGSLLPAAAPAAGQSVERSLAVAVVDGGGAPAAGLGPADFVVREDGVRREVLRARPDTTPLEVALLVDTSTAARRAIGGFRAGLRAFIDTMDAGGGIAIIGFGGRPRILAASTPARAPLLDAADGLFSSAGAAAYLLDALEETAAGFRKRAARRPVIVVLATEGLDHSHTSVASVLRDLETAAITLHAVVLTGRGYGSENRGAGADGFAQWRLDRDRALQRGPLLTGGRRRSLLVHSGVEGSMRQVAAELRGRYLVTYAAPRTLLPPEEIDVRVARGNLSARAVRVDAGESFDP